MVDSVRDPLQRTLQDDKNFICGVVEGFYGRPWSLEQRKDLFRKFKMWGMCSYVYAPKDDYKHRAFWRELYTVDEADNLSGLISAAKEAGIVFYYALSPGLDMTYSSQKEIATLKRKLDQVSQFGCEAFALLFDDIESELSKADKEVFQTFANAQVSVTNEIYVHLSSPKFLFCPTQYCASRAVPNVHDSEYLNTLGSKLNHNIDILWTGNKVISKTITLESIQEITEVLRRPPVIWDNLHANDYDQKRVFLGPYVGRSPELIPHLRGVMTNPNCEFYANFIAIHTLAYWSQCNMDSKMNSSLSADIKLETENEDELPVEFLSKNIYHPRLALKNAISEWLPEFFMEKEAWGPITKPQPQVQMVMPIIPIIPSINTCMSLTTTTTTSTNTRTVPEVNTTQLQALADVCSTVNSSSLTPISNAVMNSLVSPTKVVTNDEIINPIPTTAASNIELPKKIPISIVPVPIMEAKGVEDSGDSAAESDGTEPAEPTTPKLLKPEQVESAASVEDDIIFEGKPGVVANLSVDTMLDEASSSPLSTGINEPMECSSSIASQISPKEATKLVADDVVMSSVNDLHSMHVESSSSSPLSNAEMNEDEAEDNDKTNANSGKINADDLGLLCDLFYLPFEHGSRGLKLLSEFNWLKSNANVLLHERSSGDANNGTTAAKPEVTEWLQRAEHFSTLCGNVQTLLVKIAGCDNKEICHDLYAYVWDISGALSLLNGYVKWLALAQFPPNMCSYTHGSYTWFSKGWKEAFMSGDQEPWVFRGGLTADLQRLMPVDSGNDLFVYKLPEQPTTNYYLLRPFMPADEQHVYRICTRTYLDYHNENDLEIPADVANIIADSEVGAYITLNPELCIVAYDEFNTIVGYACASLDVSIFQRNLDVCWLPEMREKYPKSLLETEGNADEGFQKRTEFLSHFLEKFHNNCTTKASPADVIGSFPAILTAATLPDAEHRDNGISKRLLTVLLAALRANGCFGVHVCVAEKDTEKVAFYSRLGFAEIYRDGSDNLIYFGRRF
ncbi:protein O-GlcNAcase [Scaptodrosophila lebanonensis]|uniref:protein O-GlcNAcase n=1 Tax=Drosophila lebanonensis TaxID=7225 RepID=A0A6J2TFT8_DROLE|nr:protein O-GlcNAcase [Scaptodrosophila lebanonensis]